MSKTKGNNYFLMLENMAECSCRAAELLKKVLTNFDVEKLDEEIVNIHAIEHEGDERKHKLVSSLMKEFITPIDREDIMAIANTIDDVTDAVEDVLIRIYMYNITVICPNAIAFTDIIENICNEMHQMFKDFHNYKKPKTIHNSIVEINCLEEKGDDLYLKSVREMYASPVDAKETAAWTEVYNCMEKVCDVCEHAADFVEHVIMKNT